MLQMVRTQRGPNRSLNLAENIHRMLNRTVFTDEAPEVMVRVQPNSFMNDSKNTPKVLNVPHIIIIMIEETTAMT
jgi:hypothetical protein